MTSPSTPIQNQAINDFAGGNEALTVSTPGSDSMPVVSQDRSTYSKMPYMPTMDLEEAEGDAPSRFFLATPSEICQERGVSCFSLFQSRGNEQTPANGDIHETRSPHHPCASFISCSGEGERDDDDMIDEEVAVACDRAHRHHPVSMPARFKLCPKPLREEQAWDPDLLFRS